MAGNARYRRNTYGERYKMMRFGLILGLILTASIACAQTAVELPVINGQLSLSQAVDIALKYSPTIAGRRALSDAASARFSSTKSMKQVTTILSGTLDSSNMQMIMPGVEGLGPSSGTIVPDRARAGLTVMAMYPLTTGGRLESMIRASSAIKNSSELDITLSELDTALAVKTAYRQVSLALLLQDSAQKWVDEFLERVRLAEVSFAQGKTAKFDLLRNKTELADASAKLNTAKRNVAVELIRLKSVMGISQESSPEMSDPLSESVPLLENTVLVAKALNDRPDVLSAKKMVEGKKEMLRAAKAASAPQVYAIAMGQVESVQGMVFDKGYLLGLTAAMPLSDGGVRRSGIDEAKAMLKEAESNLSAIELAVRAEVAINIADVDVASKNLALASDAIKQAEEDCKVICLRYDAGKATNAEVLDAYASLNSARSARAQALYNLNNAQDTLLRTTGSK
jgi:outer membrane protein, multidrug efflux system